MIMTNGIQLLMSLDVETYLECKQSSATRLTLFQLFFPLYLTELSIMHTWSWQLFEAILCLINNK